MNNDLIKRLRDFESPHAIAAANALEVQDKRIAELEAARDAMNDPVVRRIVEGG
jgi:hypothetical protein